MAFGDGLPNTSIHIADYESMQLGLRSLFFFVEREQSVQYHSLSRGREWSSAYTEVLMCFSLNEQ